MKHLLSIEDLSLAEINTILDGAVQMHDLQHRQVKKLPSLRGRTVVNMFFEDSTRTRSSFEIAAKWLSADAINISGKGSSISKGESLRDTLMTLDAMGIDAIVIRHYGSGAAQQATQWVKASVINAGDGWHAHPSQALLDAYTMQHHFHAINSPDWSHKVIAIVGDLLHSRVVRSNVSLLNKLGARVVLVAPPTLMPPNVSNWQVETSYDFDSVISDVDVCMMLRVQRERMQGGFFPSEREYIATYGLTTSRLNKLKPTAIICHPGPLNRGLEISSTAADSPKARILNQVSAGVAVRMSILYQVLGGSNEEIK